MIEIASFRQPVLIYNPAAGKFRRNPERILQRTIAALARGGISPRHLPTSEPGHAESLAREAVATGRRSDPGAGRRRHHQRSRQGHGRSRTSRWAFCRAAPRTCWRWSSAWARDWSARPSRLAAFEPRPVALGRITGSFGSRYFLLMAGAGLDANIVYEVSAGLKTPPGNWPTGSRASDAFSKRVDSLKCRWTHKFTSAASR